MLTMNFDAWVRAACETAARNLRREEWQRYFANEEYRLTRRCRDGARRW
ncbi:MAG TPA: hypothetical protein VK923_16425 [Euzebyales bacterium]|nr:hypothetical protein [Euzebyales bacterium]